MKQAVTFSVDVGTLRYSQPLPLPPRLYALQPGGWVCFALPDATIKGQLGDFRDTRALYSWI